MNNLVIYCKSYRTDLALVTRLHESIQKYNIDDIPFYISCPETDLDLFRNALGTDTNIITDESILNNKINQSWHSQQVVKLSFWKTNLTKNYLCIDSDSEFIKEFKISDFIYNGDIPYTVCHEQKELLEWSTKFPNLYTHIYNGYSGDRLQIMKFFNRKGKLYDFGPSPVIFNASVLKSLQDKYMTPNNLTYNQLIYFCPSEFSWYGEWLLYDKTIPIYPSEALFKVFHYKEQYDDYLTTGYTLENLKLNYLGIVMQSNWKR